MTDQQPTQEHVDQWVPERWQGTAYSDLPPGLRNLVARRTGTPLDG